MSSIKEIQLEDLAGDSTFFNDLKSGRYILVLGAGFSYGLPNRAGGTIPLVREFVTLTKSKFNIDISDDNYNDAASEWQEYIEAGQTDDEQKKRFNEFKDIFLLDESLFEAKKELYANILLPKWNHIYTLNFDNVLSCVLEGKDIPYEIQNFQAGSFSPECSLGIGYLHNSMLEANSVKDLIFTTEEYSNKLDDNHLYYAMLNDIKKHGKNIVIIGSRFNEGPVTRFILNINKGIRPDLKIIHINFRAKPRYGTETEKHLHDKNWINCSTEDFLHFLQENKHKIQDISLEGATIINKGFIDGLQSSGEFPKSKFYSAKQDDNCQWYGIFHDFDVIRKNYGTIKEEVLHVFDTAAISKVATIVHGTGGCGKSTLLRRLALELAQETGFTIVWIKDRNLRNFTVNALPVIQADSRNKYLVILEDWYRLTADDPESGKTLLDAIQSINNIRLVIGDRDVKGKEYLLHLIKPECLFKLAENENENIISEIISKHPEWKQPSGIILSNPNSYNAPLFLILFAIAGISESRFDRNDIDFSDLNNTVRRIAKYDLKKIAGSNTGLAKALYYWSCVYEKNKVFITYDCFLQIADHYNKNEEASSYYQNWDAHSYILEKIRLYINVSSIERIERRFQISNLVQFNHDKLAEDILAKVDFENWDLYDDIQKLRLLDIVTEKGDDYSSATLLDAFLRQESQVFRNDAAKRSYIDKLLYKRNVLISSYLNHLTKLNLSVTELYTYLAHLQKKGLYLSAAWLEYFKAAPENEKQEVMRGLLLDEHPELIPHEIINVMLSQPGIEKEKQAAIHLILTHKDLLSINPHTLSAALSKSLSDPDRQAAAHRILTYEGLLKLNPTIIMAILVQRGNEMEKRAAIEQILQPEGLLDLNQGVIRVALAQTGTKEKTTIFRHILTHSKFFNFNPILVKAALQEPGNETEKQSAANAILTYEDLVNLNPLLLKAAFSLAGNTAEKQAAAKRILTTPDFIKLNHFIITAALAQEGNQAEKQTIIDQVLAQEDISNINYSIIQIVLLIVDNEKKEAWAKRILTHKDLFSFHPPLITTAMAQPGNETEKRAALKKILTCQDPAQLNPHLLTTAFAQSGYENEKQIAANTILTHPDLANLNPILVTAAFSQLQKTDEKKQAAKTILTNKDIAGLNANLLMTAFVQPGNEAEKQAAANFLLQHMALIHLNPHLLILALTQPGNETEKQRAVTSLLADQGLFNMDPHLLSIILALPGNETEKQNAVNAILKHQHIFNLHPYIIKAAFDSPGNEAGKKAAADHIFAYEHFLHLHPDVLAAACTQPGNETKKQLAENSISGNREKNSLAGRLNEHLGKPPEFAGLSTDELLVYPHHVMMHFFKQPGNEEKKQALAKDILTSKAFLSLAGPILVAAFKQPGNEPEKTAAAKEILVQDDLLKPEVVIIVAAFKQPGNEKEKQAAAAKILSHPYLLTLNHNILIPAFREPGNLPEKQHAAKKILNDPQWYEDKNLLSVLEALRFYSAHNPAYKFVNQKIRTIIQDYHKQVAGNLTKNFYFGLLHIPFHQNELWKAETMKIISHWGWPQRRAISNVLQSYRSHPSVISGACRSILENWKVEIDKPIYQSYGKVQYGNHIKIAMGHPDHKFLALKTAYEIIESRDEGTITIPEYLYAIARQIVDQAVFPEWQA